MLLCRAVTSRSRAEPLSPEARRMAIIDAVTPLLIENGVSVTTRQMAEASGVAEGTIFRVFPDKRALIHQAVEHSLDPEPVRRALSEVYAGAPLDRQVAAAARILLDRYDRVIALMSLLRTLPPDEHDSSHVGPPPAIARSSEVIMEVLTELFERHSDELRIPPRRAAATFRALIFAVAHPVMVGEEKLTVPEVIDVLLSGVAHPERVVS